MFKTQYGIIEREKKHSLFEDISDCHCEDCDDMFTLKIEAVHPS
jgi:hypothetical protein